MTLLKLIYADNVYFVFNMNYVRSFSDEVLTNKRACNIVYDSGETERYTDFKEIKLIEV